MRHRQTVPRQWLMITDEKAVAGVRRLSRGSGVLVATRLPPREMRRLRHLARLRNLTVVSEDPSGAARVHNLPELRRALLDRTPLILLSPIHATPSHPTWKPIARMRAAAMARLSRGRLLALGGMDARRFARIRRLGFQGWAGISAFRT